MTLARIITEKFRTVFVLTLVSTILVSGVYVVFVSFSAERAAVGLVDDHIERMIRNTSLRAEEIFIQRELDQFTTSLGNTQSFTANIAVYQGNRLIARSSSGKAFGFRVRNLTKTLHLPSGDSLKVEAQIDMSVQIITAMGTSLVLTLISCISLLLTFSHQRKTIDRLVKPITNFSRNLELSSSSLPNSLYQEQPPITDDNIDILEVKSLIRSRSLLFSSLKDLYQEQERNQFLKARAEIAAQVTHDIRSPLSAINIIASSIESNLFERSSLLKAAVERINLIAEDLLTVERAFVRKLEKIRVFDLLSELASQKQLEYANLKNIIFDFDFSEDTYVLCNPNDIQRVVSNLINNSVEALNGSGIIKVFTRKSAEGALIVVMDNGPGLPGDVQTRIGQRGNSSSASQPGKGSGLGLYHATQILEANNG